MDIKPYLLELLATQKKVGINALGMLYKKKIPGRYDLGTHSFLPPKYELDFTSEITNDTTLATFIVEEENISIELATFYINEFVEGIQSQLADHHYADFSPFGDLKQVDGEIILFEPAKKNDFSFDFYGLPSVSAALEKSQISSQALETAVEAQELQLVEDNRELETAVEAQELQPDENNLKLETNLETQLLRANQNKEEPNTAVDEPIQNKFTTEQSPFVTDPLWKPTVINRYEYDEDDEDDENSKPWIAKLLKIAITLIIIAAIAGAMIYYFYPDLFNAIKGDFSNPPIESEPPINIESNNSSSKIDSPIIDSLKVALVLPSVLKDSLTTKTIYYEVIGGAMKTHKKADEIISNLLKRGINAKKVDVMPGRRIKISLGTFTDINIAKKFQDSVIKKLKNPEIYIQTIKPKN